MLKNQKSITLCKVCKLDKTEMISWNPCSHVECVDCALSRFEAVLKNQQNDRDSLVCYQQDIVCYKDICSVLKKRMDLLSKLEDKSKYNYYERQDYCPHCQKQLWIDKHHSEQRCFSCNYEYCYQCLLPVHQGMNCKNKWMAHKKEFLDKKTIVKQTGDFFRSCSQCGTYARRIHGPDLDIVWCDWCPLIKCLKHNSVPKLGTDDLCCEGLKLIQF